MKVLKYNVKAVINKGKKEVNLAAVVPTLIVLATEETKVEGHLNTQIWDHLGQFKKTPLQPKKIKKLNMCKGIMAITDCQHDYTWN